MLVLRESDVLPILKGLTRDRCRRLLQTLWDTLADYSQQQQQQDDERTGADGKGKGEEEKKKKLIHQPMRETIVTAAQHATLFMPASDTTTTTGIKIVTLPGGGGPPRGAINIFEPRGGLEGVINAEEVTAFRTALASMIPFEQFRLRRTSRRQGKDAKEEGVRVVVFGAGKQAEWHVRLALLLAGEEGIAGVTVVNRGRKGLEKLRRELEGDMRSMFSRVTMDYVARDSPDFTAEKLQRVVAAADVIFCCTPSIEPLFPDSWLDAEKQKQRFISLIGSYKPHMQEVDSATLLSGCEGVVLVDSTEACLAEAGELIQAGVTAEQLVEIGALRSDSDGVSARVFESGHNVVFKCVGMGIMDVVMGRELLGLAREQQVGVTIDGF